jgi:hypothetical protein
MSCAKLQDSRLGSFTPLTSRDSRRGNGWADWFEGLSFTHEEGGTTLLHGQVVDQAALYGLLRKVRDLGMPLISVSCVKPSQADE